jgi:CubicO group peptidase (beta-lactamase class C family)
LPSPAHAAGPDAVAVGEAVAGALADEPALPRDMRAWLRRTLAAEPWPHILGDVTDRAGPTGVVLVGGREIASFGEPDRVDMCFSLAKSALATTAGIAWDDGLLGDLDAPAGAVVALPELAGRAITWRHLLTQTSDWRGELFGIPFWADPQGRQGPDEPLHGSGVRFAYNDVRTNLLALALTHVHGRSLEAVLRERIMEPIGCGSGWSWRGLHGMRTTLADGTDVPVVTGGSHWGGGWWASARDLARFGLLHLRAGEWDGRRLLSSEWCARMREPCPVRPAYGLMWWRNEPGGAEYPGCGAQGFAAHGTGEQVVWCDPERDLVAVVRWVREPARFLAALTAAIPGDG